MIQFKTDRVQSEWNLLPVHNRRLKWTIEMLVLFADIEMKKDVVLTCIFRSPEENAAANGIPNSPHLVWNAVDIRSSTFTPAEIDRLLTFLNNVTYHNGKKTAICHAVPGGAMHFHIQVLKEGEA